MTGLRLATAENGKPIFMGRDSVIKYDVTQIEAERRNGYAWYVDSALDLVTRDYQKWKKSLEKGLQEK